MWRFSLSYQNDMITCGKQIIKYNLLDMKKTPIFVLLVMVTVMISYFIFTEERVENKNGLTPTTIVTAVTAESQEKEGLKTFTFNSFHGSSEISDKFKFQYPANWHNEGQYFSPQKIQFYDLYTVKAPIYFDLILADIFDQTEFKYQIDNSKRRASDTIGQIDGKDFKKYDLIDSGSYGGESAGRVKIFVGPKIKIDGSDYFLVFHWEERPLAEEMPGNDLDVFDNMLLTLKFFH